MRLGYVWSRPIPSRDTDTQQMMKTVDALAAEGADVELILPRSRHLRNVGLPAFEAELRAFYSLHARFRLRPLRGLEPSRELERPLHALIACASLEDGRYDVVYTRSRSAALLCALRGLPLVFETYRMLGKEHPLLVRAYARLAARQKLLGIITHSHLARASIEAAGFPGDKLATIHNGFDPEDLQPTMVRDQARAELGLNTAGAVACYTGDVRGRKGIAALLELGARTPEVTMLIAGGHDPDIRALSAEIANRRLGNVRCLGWRRAAELRPLLYAADVLLVPPTAVPLRRHGRTVLPMKIFSYLAVGRAILAPALPDLQELLHHGENAWLVAPDDAPAAAAALRRLVTDRALAAELAAGARRSAPGLTRRARARAMLAQIGRWQAGT